MIIFRSDVDKTSCVGSLLVVVNFSRDCLRSSLGARSRVQCSERIQFEVVTCLLAIKQCINFVITIIFVKFNSASPLRTPNASLPNLQIHQQDCKFWALKSSSLDTTLKNPAPEISKSSNATFPSSSNPQVLSTLQLSQAVCPCTSSKMQVVPAHRPKSRDEDFYSMSLSVSVLSEELVLYLSVCNYCICIVNNAACLLGPFTTVLDRGEILGGK